MLYLILFILSFISVKGEDPPQAPHSLLPKGKCLPTAVEVGPCHTCVCDNNGVYICRNQDCDTQKLSEVAQGKLDVDECTPHMLYKDGILWCSCTDKKRWKSESCRQNFYHTRNKVPLRKTKISIDAIQCDKNDYYVVDCNVCLCKSGILDEASCTNRTCLEGSKVDDCKYGQVLRLDGELCTCSELGFYIDKLCIKVKGVNTKIEQKDLAILTHEVKGMKENKRTLKDKNLKCEPNSIFNVDCNKCWCSEDGKDMKCTAKLCSPEILKQTMFQGKSEARSSLPIIESLTSSCTPGLYYRYQCKTCFCNKDGTIRCASMICLDVEDEFETDSPNIPEGEKCVKGQTYKKDCGTCTCNENNRMMCSKTACLSPEERDELSKIQQQHSKISQQKEKVTENDQKTVREGNKNHNIKIIEINKNGTPNKKIGFNKSDFKSAGDKKKTIKLNTIQTGNDFEMRAKNDELEKIKLHAHKLGLFEEDEGDEDHDQDNSDYKPIKLTDASGRFPLLNLKVKCTPGRIYTKGCQRCFCCNQKKPRCTNKPCKAMSKKVKVPSDVTPSISGLDFARMASLPHEAAKCTPGKSYKVRCNRCICLANGNLLCENKLCASIAEINANTAWRYNGNTCKSDEDPPHPGDCITCKCEKKEFKCNPRPKCIPRKFNSASILKNVKHLEINSTMDCVPHMVYKQACNDCYCQADHSLRCTRKGCLSYTQVKKLDEVRQKLLQEGL